MYEIQNLYLEHIDSLTLKSYLELLYSKHIVGYYAFILHDKDVYIDTNELKKPHFHLYLEWLEPCERTVKRILKVFNQFDEIKKCSIRVKYVYNKKKAIRYLTHKDDIDKYQYNDNDVVTCDIHLYNALVKPPDIKKLSHSQELLNLFVTDVTNGIICNENMLRDWFVSKNETLFYMQHTKGLIELLFAYSPNARNITDDLSLDIVALDKNGEIVRDIDLPF